MKAWQLIEAKDRQFKMDESGLFTTINFTPEKKCRIDVYRSDYTPIISLQGKSASAVQKGLADLIETYSWVLSSEHMLYIGMEIARCFAEREQYMQA